MVADLGDRCGLGDAGVRYAFRRLEEFTVVLDPLNFPLVVEMMQHVRLGTTAPKAPVWQYHSVLDEGIPFAQPAQLETRDNCA